MENWLNRFSCYSDIWSTDSLKFLTASWFIVPFNSTRIKGISPLNLTPSSQLCWRNMATWWPGNVFRITDLCTVYQQSPHKGPVRWNFNILSIVSLSNLLNHQSSWDWCKAFGVSVFCKEDITSCGCFITLIVCVWAWINAIQTFGWILKSWFYFENRVWYFCIYIRPECGILCGEYNGHWWPGNARNRYIFRKCMVFVQNIAHVLKDELIYFLIQFLKYPRSVSKLLWMRHISKAKCKTAVTPLLTYWSYCSLALSHCYDIAGVINHG